MPTVRGPIIKRGQVRTPLAEPRPEPLRPLPPVRLRGALGSKFKANLADLTNLQWLYFDPDLEPLAAIEPSRGYGRD